MYCSTCGAALPDGAAFCSACGKQTGTTVATDPGPQAGNSGMAPGQPQGVVPLPPQTQPAGGTAILYAGFWLRVVAAIIDNILLAIPEAIVGLFVFAGTFPMMMRSAEANPMTMTFLFAPRFILLALVIVAGRWLYWASMEASEWQATLGKKALGLYVTDLEGRRTTFGRTSGRFWAGRGISAVPTLGGLYYLIDCIMVAFTERKQALHDQIANCLVLRKA